MASFGALMVCERSPLELSFQSEGTWSWAASTEAACQVAGTSGRPDAEPDESVPALVDALLVGSSVGALSDPQPAIAVEMVKVRAAMVITRDILMGPHSRATEERGDGVTAVMSNSGRGAVRPRST